ncbi:MAG TPA: Ig-like domain-containing protein [Pirellulales bacterium]|nr:Ig-like domain-containing protein [Pirellulales bacterium]
MFDVPQGNSSNPLAVTLEGLTITGGTALDTSAEGTLEQYGGGMRIGFFDNVTIANCTFQGNQAPVANSSGTLFYGLGGAVYCNGALSVRDSQFNGNLCANSGGALYLDGGSAILQNTTFNGNRSGLGAGAIETFVPMTVNGCTFSNNLARTPGGYSGQGGAIDVQPASSSTFANSTITGNQGGVGGGICASGPLTIQSCTIANNQGSSGGGIFYSSGGTRIENSILSANTASAGPDVYGTIASLGHNIISNAAGSGGFGAAGDQLNVDPKLGALANNGGPTQTLALLAGSPAIDVANPATAPAVDQRGAARPAGNGPDIGAYEYNGSINSAPVANDDGYAVNENATLNVVAPGVLANDTAPSGVAISATLVSGPSYGSLTLNADGSFTYTPASGYYGTDSFTYDDVEGSLTSNTATVRITVNTLDRAPVAANDSYLVQGNGILNAAAPGVLANDSDPDGDALTASLSSGPSHGSLTLNANGSFSYIPTAYYSGPDSFTYRAYDGQLYSNVVTVSLSVDQPPTAQSASYTTDENVSTNIQLTGSDVETPTSQLTFIVAALPTHGSLTDTSGNPVGAFARFTGPVTLIYTPANDYSGTDSMLFQANDGQFNSHAATISFTINHVNQPPVAANDSYSTSEDTPLVVQGAPVTTLTMVSDPGDYIGQGKTYNFSTTTGSFSVTHYTIATSYQNMVKFSYQDQNPNEWWYLNFIAPQHALLVPGVYDNAARALFEMDSQPGLDVYGDGRGSNTLTGSFTVTQAVYDANGNVLNFDATFEQHSEGATPALRGEIKYNAPPAMTGVLTNDTDVDSSLLTAVLVSGPSHGSVSLNSDGSFTYTPDANFNGIDSFTYKANDGSLDSNIATATIAVNPVNDAPSFTKGGDQAIAEGAGPQSVPGWATNVSAGPPDEASQTLDFQVSTNNDALFATAPTIDPATGTLTYAPAPGALGSATVTVALHDNGGTANGGVDTSAPQTFTISISNVAPTVTLIGSASVNEGDTFSTTGSFVDPGVETWTATVDYGDGGGTQPLVLNPDKTFNLNHIYADNGVYHVTVAVSDSNNGSGSSSMVVTVNNVAPTAALANSGPIDEGSAATISFSSPVDPSSADTAAGFHYSFATSAAALASDYAGAGAADSTSLTFDDNGTYTIYGRIFDKDSGFTTYSMVVTVNDVAPTATLSNSGPIGEGSVVKVTFSSPVDPSNADTVAGFHYSLALDPSTLANSYGAASPANWGTYLFSDNGSYTVYGRIFDKDGGFSDYATAVTVNNIAPTATLLAPATVGENSTVQVVLSSPFDPSTVDAAAGFHYAFAFNDSSAFDVGDGTYAGSGAADAAEIPAALVADGPSTVTIRARIIDKDGGFTDYVQVMTVTNLAPTAVMAAPSLITEGSSVVAAVGLSGSDPSPVDNAAGLRYAYDFNNDGVFDLGDGSYAGSVSDASAVIPESFRDDGPGQLTVRERIIDKDGGYNDYTKTIAINNVAPTAVLSNNGSANEGSPAIVSFANAFDPSTTDTQAGFHYSFAISAAGLAGSYGAAGTARSSSFAFGDNGSYTAFGRIFDKDGGYTDYTTTVTVNNVAPTATLSNNGPVDEGGSATVSFTNPFDPSMADTQAGFHYSYATSAADLAASYAAAGSTSNDLISFDDNGNYTVFGRIFDKDGGYTDYTTVVTVNNVPPTASVAGPTLAVRGQTQTFTLAASDPSPVDQAAAFSYLVDWGDGSPQQTIGGAASSTQASHIFTAGGTFTVRVWATDKDGGQSASPGAFTLAVQAAALEGGNLVIGGTTADDSITVAPSDKNGNLAVTINGASAGVFHPTGQIIVYAQAGNDQVRLQNARIARSTVYVSVPAVLFGGDGNDTLDARGSTANDILLGEAGNDVLYGGRGRNLLIGGLGADSLNGGSGDDILIGGTTDYDGNLSALDAIMAEWSRTDLTYQQRINQLTGAASGGLNGSYDLNATTVLDDAAIDQLQGNGGTDWYFSRVSGASADVISGKQKGEIVTSI